MKYLIENDYGIYEEPSDPVDSLDEDTELIEVEERTVYADKENNFSITVDGDGETDRGFINDPYLKFYRSKSPKGTTPIRIAIKSPQYIIHNNNNDTLSSKERKMLAKVMTNNSNVKAYNNLTVWEAIKQAAKDETENITEDQAKKLDNLKCPDFKNIKPAK